MDEVYGSLWTTRPVPHGVTDWSPAWVAVDRGGLAGVAMTSGEWIEDLWVTAEARSHGTGSALLQQCEEEIRGRGIQRARLRVVGSNVNAISFYRARGWVADGLSPHESLPVRMLNMRKSL